MTRDDVIDIARASCVSEGCTCDPVIEVVETDEHFDAHIIHKSWCPLVAKRMAWLN